MTSRPASADSSRLRVNELTLRGLVYVLLLLSVLWGTGLSLSMFQQVWMERILGFNISAFIFGVLGLVAWGNAFYVHGRIRRYGAVQLGQRWWSRRRWSLLTTAALIAILIIARHVSALSGWTWLATPVNLLLLPQMVGDLVAVSSGIFFARHIPFLAWLNELAWVLRWGVEIIAVYYIVSFFGRLGTTAGRSTIEGNG